MTTPSWPGTVNQNVEQDGFAEAPERNVVSFQPEVGPPTERRRTSISTNVFSFTSQCTSAEYDAIVDFYRNTLLDGVLTFTRNHPRTGVSANFKFTDVPKVSQVMEPVYLIAYSMRLMP